MFVERLSRALGSADGAAFGPGDALVVVDPGAWAAEAATPPTDVQLARTVGVSVAPPGSPALREDARIAPRLGAIVHHDPVAVAHLTRAGGRAHHLEPGYDIEAEVPIGHPRPVDLVTAGGTSARRLRAVAGGAPWCDLRTTRHLFDEPGRLASGASTDPLDDARVLVDIADDDDAAPDPLVLVRAFERGAALVTERLGVLGPDGIDACMVRAPRETLFLRAAELADDPGRCAELVRSGRELLAREASAGSAAEALARVIGGLDPGSAVFPAPDTPPARDFGPTLADRIGDERRRPDAALRSGVQDALRSLRRLEERVARVELGIEADVIETLLAAPDDGPPPVVSIVVPAYGARSTLLETLDSVRATSEEDGAPAIELVVVDDASPSGDGDAAVAWAVDGGDLPVTVLRHRANRGLAATRNSGLSRARGTFVLPLDADNLLRPRGVVRLHSALERDPEAAFAYGILQEFDYGGPRGVRGIRPWEPERLRYGNWIDALALLRTDVLRSTGGYATDMPEQGYEDWSLWCTFAERGDRGVWVPEMVASYRLRGGSMSERLHLSHVAPLQDLVARHPGVLT